MINYSTNPGEYYLTRKSILQKNLLILQRKKTGFGIWRLGNILLVIAAIYFLSSFGWYYAAVASVVLLFIFVRLVYADLRNRDEIKHVNHLIKIQEDELLALQGKYYHFDDGEILKPHDHFYANDMDVLGHASLYQYTNRTSSEQAGEKLAGWLLSAASVTDIKSRQTAVKELAKNQEWGQNLQATGREKMISTGMQKRLEGWMKQPTVFLQFTMWKWLRFILPAIMLTVSALVIFDYLSMNTFYIFLFIFAVIAYQINKIVSPIHQQLDKTAEELGVLSLQIKIIENAAFKAPLLDGIVKTYSSDGLKASGKIKKLSKILDRLDLRYDMVLSAPLNLFLMWNLQQVLDLEKWKMNNQENIEHWFDQLAEMECLHSFATLHFNHPHWTWPDIKEDYFSAEAKELGHPLIPENKRVTNDLSIDSRGKIMLVTGSNMGGKSTYLRSIGVNIILAMAGAPVCASYFSLSHVQLLSSMRVADNLEESTSTFYAELKKLQLIIEKVNAGEKVFVLLDEILRGTNSHDRHTGSVALVKQFIKQKAAAILATHDIELAGIVNDYPDEILNYHFDVQVQGEELFFDYKLKSGICTSMNASILMKKIGIEISEKQEKVKSLK